MPILELFVSIIEKWFFSKRKKIIISVSWYFLSKDYFFLNKKTPANQFVVSRPDPARKSQPLAQVVEETDVARVSADILNILNIARNVKFPPFILQIILVFFLSINSYIFFLILFLPYIDAAAEVGRGAVLGAVLAAAAALFETAWYGEETPTQVARHERLVDELKKTSF